MPHPDYLLDSLTSQQLLDWQTYARQHGLGPRRDDIHWGSLLALLSNIHRDPKEPAVTPQDCMPYVDPYADDLTADQLRERIGLQRHKRT